MNLMTDQLLTIKLYAPPLRQGLVNRPRLMQKLNQGLQMGSRLTLIAAPAGYGKTTLALEWLENLKRPYTWLSVDRDDNHPAQFLGYLIAALERMDKKIGEQIWPVVEALDPPENSLEHVQILLTEMLNAVASTADPFVLALDDYHAITELGVHQALGYLIEHQPPQMHLLITTRQDPMLPLSKLRSRGQITEVRLGELRFTNEEAEVFLSETMGLHLIPEQVAALEARTEGWIAGLQLAAVSLSELSAWSPAAPDPQALAKHIQAFAGDDRHVVDYLMDEVLSRQPEKVQRFLLDSSVLKRLSAPLCEAVMQVEKLKVDCKPGDFQAEQCTAAQFLTCQQILEHLERANLFIVPLDNRRQWYRYHHLFADLLWSRLQSTYPERISKLHCRASEWYEQAGMIDDAVDHALLAEEFERALHLIEQAARSSIWASGDLPVLLNWSRRLPEDVLMSRPRLCLYYARALFFNGQVEAAESYLQAAENTLRARGRIDGQIEELWGVLFTNQATFRSMRGDWQAALELASQAQGRIPAVDISTRARIGHAVGMAEYLRGDVLGAEAAFSEAAQLALQAGNRNLGLDLVSCQALNLILAGRLSQSVQICEDALAADPVNRLAPPASSIYLALAKIHYERNELHQAQSRLEICLALGRKAGWPHVLWQAYVLEAQVMQAMGDHSAALVTMREAEQVSRQYPVPRVSRLVSAYRASAELTAGHIEPAGRWAEKYRRQEPVDGLRDFEELTLAAILVSQDRLSDALAVVDDLIATAKPAGRMASVIEASAIRSVVLASLGEQAEALEDLVRVLEQAETEGFERIFLDGGKTMADLLSRVRRTRAPGCVISYAWKLLEAFKDQGIEPEDTLSASLPSNMLVECGALIEPLSERELEVVGLIAEGLSNPEIAARLFLSVNTLRAHTTNIYRKLDVHNRVQAVSRARGFGLLPNE